MYVEDPRPKTEGRWYEQRKHMNRGPSGSHLVQMGVVVDDNNPCANGLEKGNICLSLELTLDDDI